MRVTKPDYQTAVACFHIRPLDGEATKVAESTTPKGVFFLQHLQTCAVQSLMRLINEKRMGNRGVGVGWVGGLSDHAVFTQSFDDQTCV